MNYTIESLLDHNKVCIMGVVNLPHYNGESKAQRKLKPVHVQMVNGEARI